MNDSDSMTRSRWSTTSEVLAKIAVIAVKYDNDDIDLRFFNNHIEHEKRKNLDSSEKLMALFKRVTPDGLKPTADALELELNSYLNRFKENRERKMLNLIELKDSEGEEPTVWGHDTRARGKTFWYPAVHDFLSLNADHWWGGIITSYIDRLNKTDWFPVFWTDAIILFNVCRNQISSSFMQSIRKPDSSKLMTFLCRRMVNSLRTFLYLSNQSLISTIVEASNRFTVSGFVLILCKLLLFHQPRNHTLVGADRLWALFKLTTAPYIISVVRRMLHISNERMNFSMTSSSCFSRILLCSSCFLFEFRLINAVNVLTLTSWILAAMTLFSVGFPITTPWPRSIW